MPADLISRIRTDTMATDYLLESIGVEFLACLFAWTVELISHMKWWVGEAI